MKKLCRKCRIEKDIGFFHKSKRNKDGYKNICFECRRKEYLKPPEQVKKFLEDKVERFRRYGLSHKGRKRTQEEKQKVSEGLKRRWKNKWDPNVTQFNRVYSTYKGRGLTWEKEEFKEFTKRNCHYCGTVPGRIQTTINRPGKYIYNGIDRVNNNMGYTKENCVPCCLKCNQAKLNYAQDEFLEWVRMVYLHSYHIVTTST